MRLQSDVRPRRTATLSLLLMLITAIGVSVGRLRAQDNAARTADALAYIAEHADREEKVMIPMRDGVRLSATILFPKDRPRQNLPTVLFRSPYLIEPGEPSISTSIRELKGRRGDNEANGRASGGRQRGGRRIGRWKSVFRRQEARQCAACPACCGARGRAPMRLGTPRPGGRLACMPDG